MRRCGQSRWVRLRVLNSPQPSAGHDLRQGNAVDGNEPQRTLDNILADIRDVSGNGVGAPEDTEAQSSHARAIEGERGRHHEVQQDAQGPNIHQWSDVTLVPKEFRGRVGRRAAEGGENVGGFAFSAETKVAHLDAVCGGVEDIFSLQVPMDDVVVMLKIKKKKNAGSVMRLYFLIAYFYIWSL